jgi:hypothetical protein
MAGDKTNNVKGGGKQPLVGNGNPEPETKKTKTTKKTEQQLSEIAHAKEQAEAPQVAHYNTENTDTKSPEEEVETSTVEKKIADVKNIVHENAQQNSTFQKQLTGTLKEVEKDVTKLRKISEKKSSKINKKEKGEKKNTESGFAKPTKMSDALCDFLKVPHGTEMPRTAVNSQISKYIKENRLDYDSNLPGDKQDRRNFRTDSKLEKIFNMGLLAPGEKPGYFNMAKLINHNFIKEKIPSQ